jgi:pSer/pThr/pTyr-binding forkhead associated (FHA) protein
MSCLARGGCTITAGRDIVLASARPMRVTLSITAGPHTGREFAFDRHDTFLVGRSKDAHFQLTYDDPYFSRRHFLVEVNPPRVRVFDLNSHNGGTRQRFSHCEPASVA